MGEVMELLEVVKSYCAIQDELLKELRTRAGAKLADPNPQRWPQTGELAVQGRSWRFSRHGRGYRFVDPVDSCVIEAHDGVHLSPSPFDAYRLQEFLVSLGVSRVRSKDRAFETSEILSLQQGLEDLVAQGFIEHIPLFRGGVLRSYVIKETSSSRAT